MLALLRGRRPRKQDLQEGILEVKHVRRDHIAHGRPHAAGLLRDTGQRGPVGLADPVEATWSMEIETAIFVQPMGRRDGCGPGHRLADQLLTGGVQCRTLALALEDVHRPREIVALEGQIHPNLVVQDPLHLVGRRRQEKRSRRVPERGRGEAILPADTREDAVHILHPERLRLGEERDHRERVHQGCVPLRQTGDLEFILLLVEGAELDLVLQLASLELVLVLQLLGGEEFLLTKSLGVEQEIASQHTGPEHLIVLQGRQGRARDASHTVLAEVLLQLRGSPQGLLEAQGERVPTLDALALDREECVRTVRLRRELHGRRHPVELLLEIQDRGAGDPTQRINLALVQRLIDRGGTRHVARVPFLGHAQRIARHEGGLLPTQGPVLLLVIRLIVDLVDRHQRNRRSTFRM